MSIKSLTREWAANFGENRHQISQKIVEKEQQQEREEEKCMSDLNT